MQKVQKKMDGGKKKYNVRVIGNDSYLSDDTMAYMLDYSVSSSQVGGTNCKGSVYIRGVKGKEGVDSFKFILEKANDFSDFDAEMIVDAYENAFKDIQVPKSNKQKIDDIETDSSMTPA